MHYEYPSQREVEVPLLRLIAQKGGQIELSLHGDILEKELADYFGLSKDAREFTLPTVKARGRRVWLNHIQYTRLKLVEKGQIDNAVRDRWKMTEAGYRRIGMHALEVTLHA